MIYYTVNNMQNENSIITIDNAAQYLLNRNLLNTKSIIDGDLKIVDASRRNRNIKIIRKHGPSFFIKQPNPTDIEGIVAIKRESLLYALIQTNSEFNVLKDMIPQIVDFDERKNILITEYIVNGRPWSEYNYGESAGVIQKEHTLTLGRLLAKYHTLNNELHDNKKLDFLPKTFEPGMSLIRPGPEIFKDLSSANYKLLKLILQYESLYDALDNLHSIWQPQTLIHGDIKFDNIIISPSVSDNIQTEMKIVDWESASIGDPAWDIGCIFHELIASWVYFLPITGAEPPEQLIISNKDQIQLMQSAARTFWFAYTKANPQDSTKLNELLIKSTKMCAARMIQNAYESLFSSTDISNTIIYMIQMSHNIFKNTESAVTHLLGIPFRGLY